MWRIGNRIEAFELRHLGVSPMSLLDRGDVMVLETTGRRTGRRRFTPVAYWKDGQGAFRLGGGGAGMTTVPDWVRNPSSKPSRNRVDTSIESGEITHELTDVERDRAQPEATKIWPGVPRYELKSRRVIPYFRLVPDPHS